MHGHQGRVRVRRPQTKRQPNPCPPIPSNADASSKRDLSELVQPSVDAMRSGSLRAFPLPLHHPVPRVRGPVDVDGAVPDVHVLVHRRVAVARQVAMSDGLVKGGVVKVRVEGGGAGRSLVRKVREVCRVVVGAVEVMRGVEMTMRTAQRRSDVVSVEGRSGVVGFGERVGDVVVLRRGEVTMALGGRVQVMSRGANGSRSICWRLEARRLLRRRLCGLRRSHGQEQRLRDVAGATYFSRGTERRQGSVAAFGDRDSGVAQQQACARVCVTASISISARSLATPVQSALPIPALDPSPCPQSLSVDDFFPIRRRDRY